MVVQPLQVQTKYNIFLCTPTWIEPFYYKIILFRFIFCREIGREYIMMESKEFKPQAGYSISK